MTTPGFKTPQGGAKTQLVGIDAGLLGKAFRVEELRLAGDSKGRGLVHVGEPPERNSSNDYPKLRSRLA